MKKQSKSIMAATTFFALTFLIFAATTGLAGDLEPSAAPGPTMKTLDQIPPTWDQVLPAAERFVLVMNGAAVLDKETGLVWEKSPLNWTYSWQNATDTCIARPVGGRYGWRLPTIEELTSLKQEIGGGLPTGHPFENILDDLMYWSSTTRDSDNWAYGTLFGNFAPSSSDKSSSYHFWCVRGGRGN